MAVIKVYCKNCRNQVKEDWKYCPNCKANLQNGNIETDEKVIIEQNEKDKKNSLICICIFLISTLLLFITNKYAIVFFLISLISIVTGFIKYPNNKIIKVFFWLFLIGIIFYVLLITFLLLTCENILTSWNCSNVNW